MFSWLIPYSSHWPNCNWCSNKGGNQHITNPSDGDGFDSSEPDYYNGPGDWGDYPDDDEGDGMQQDYSLPPLLQRRMVRVRRDSVLPSVEVSSTIPVATGTPTSSMSTSSTTSETASTTNPAYDNTPMQAKKSPTPSSKCTPSPTKSLAPSASKSSSACLLHTSELLSSTFSMDNMPLCRSRRASEPRRPNLDSRSSSDRHDPERPLQCFCTCSASWRSSFSNVCLRSTCRQRSHSVLHRLQYCHTPQCQLRTNSARTGTKRQGGDIHRHIGSAGDGPGHQRYSGIEGFCWDDVDGRAG